MAEKKKMSVADILAAARADKQSGTESEKPASESKTEVPDTGVNELPASEPPASATKPAASKPVSSGRPSVQEMLAMARAGKGNPASEPKATPKPAAKQPSAKKTATAKPVAVDGAKKNVQRDTASILAAARSGAKPGPVSKAEAPALTKPTAKPVAKKVTKAPSRPVPPRPIREKQEKSSKAAVADDRRGFLSYTVGSFMAVGFTALSATGGLFSLGLARFFFPNVLA